MKEVMVIIKSGERNDFIIALINSGYKVSTKIENDVCWVVFEVPENNIK